MDVNKIGLFIAEKRKQKNLTQQELANKLHLSNRTISKWECGNGLPDSYIMMELCEVLGITVNELLSGENISNEEYKIVADRNIIALMNTPKNRFKQNIISAIFGLLLELCLILFIIICIYANVMNGTQLYDYISFPAIIIVLGTSAIILVMTGLYREFISAFKIIFCSCDNFLYEEIEKAIDSIKIVMLSASLSGFTLSIASCIGTLVNSTPVHPQAINIAFAVCLLGLLYGLIICVICIPFLGRLYKIKHQIIHTNNKEL